MRSSSLLPSSFFLLTLKAWPVIALVTIGLCFLTQQGAKLFGIDLPDQQNVEVVRRCLAQAFDSRKAFLIAASLVGQVLILMPAIEECVFRYLLFRLPEKFFTFRFSLFLTAAISSMLFSAAHYLVQPFPDAAFLALFFFGLAQCWLYKKTQRLWCAMLNHTLFNLTNLILLFIIPQN